MSNDIKKKPIRDSEDRIRKLTNREDDDFGLIIGAIKRVGPRNCSLISRLTAIPIETVRNKIHKQLIRKGIRFHISVDYSKLGLTRNWVTLDFEDEYSKLAPSILDTLSRIGYLIYYGRLVPQGSYVSIIACPFETKREYRRFLSGLIDLGILVSYEIDELDNVQQHFMKHKHYDFRKGAWNIDWTNIDQSKAIMTKVLEDSTYELMADKTDLLILKQLQLDPTATYAKIARELKTNQKTVRYHYIEHIVGRRLIKEYIIRWTAGFGVNERHSILGLIVQISNITGEALSAVQKVFHNLPFTWFDSFSHDQRLYLAYVVPPVTEYVNALNYLRRNIPKPCLQNFEVGLVDMSCSMGYTIPYEMFDEELGWVFDVDKALEEFSGSVRIMQTQNLSQK